jgi:hypothetical protein
MKTIAFLLIFVANTALAAFAPSYTYYVVPYGTTQAANLQYAKPSPSEACSTHPDTAQPSYTQMITATQGRCFSYYGQFLQHYENLYRSTGTSCPVNSTLVSGSCVCNSGYVEQAGQCITPSDPCQVTQGLTTGITSVLVEFNNVNVSASSLGSFIGQNVTTSVPIDGKSCAATGQVTDCGLFPSNNGGGSTLLCHLSGTTYTGTTYNGEQSLFGLPKVDPDATPVQDQHGVCPAGQYGGNVNGQAVCVKPNGSANTTSSTTTNPDGSTSTTTSTTSCVGDQCTETKTTTGTDAQGNSTGSSTTSTQADKRQFCEDNPNDPQCKSGSATASCDTFMCDGDAVNCAMLKKQWHDSCKLLNPDTDPGSIFNQAIAGTDGFSIESMKTGAEIIDVGTFDTTGSGWSRSCPADKIINVPVIGSFTISFQQYCPLLNSMSMVLLSITLLACLMWCIKD